MPTNNKPITLPETRTKRSLRPDFVSWSERKEPLRGVLKSMTWQDMKGGAVPKYTLETEDGLVSFLGTVQIVEAFEGIRLGSDVEIIPGDKVKTGQGFNVITFEINVYEDEPGEADKPAATRMMVSPDGEDMVFEEEDA